MLDVFFFQHSNLIGNGKYLWFLSRRLPIVFELNRSDCVVSVLFETINHKTFDSIAFHNNKMYLLSSFRRELLVYDYYTKNQIVKNVNEIEYDNWAGAYVDYNGQFVYGWQNPTIVFFNPENEKLRVVDEWSNYLRKKSTYFARAIKNPQLIGDKYYAAIGNTKSILEMDLKTVSTDLKNLLDDEIKSIICFRIIDDYGYFICQKENCAVGFYKAHVDSLSKPIELVEWEIDHSDEFSFCELVFANGLFYLIPSTFDKAFTIDTIDYTVSEISQIHTMDYSITSKNSGYNSNYFTGAYIDDCFMTINVWTMELLKINLITRELFVKKIIKDVCLENYGFDSFKNNQIMIESPECNASDYLRII